MSEQTTPEAKKSTPEQAEALYNWAVAVMESRGTDYGHSQSFGASVTEMPDLVSRYIPAPTDAAVRVGREVSASRDRSRKTGEFPSEGTVAIVGFHETELRADNSQHTTTVQYQVHKGSDGSFSLEREINRPDPDSNSAPRGGSDGSFSQREAVNSLFALRAKLEAENVAHAMNEDMGALEVSFDEAQQVIDTCAQL